MKYEVYFILYIQPLKMELILLHPALEDGTDRGFRNVGKPQSDAGEIPKRIHTRYIMVILMFVHVDKQSILLY